MEPQLEWIYLETREERPVVDRGTSLKGIKTQETRYRGDSKAVKDKENVRLEGHKHHLVAEIPGKAITPTTHPYCSDRANRLGEANLEESANKKGSKEEPPHPRSIRGQERQSSRSREGRAQSLNKPGNKEGERDGVRLGKQAHD
jgi:hypothetical protein